MTDVKQTRLLNSRYIMLLIVNLITSVSFSMVYTTMSSYVTGLGVSVAIAGVVTGAFNISSMVIRPVSGLISDRVNRKWLLVISAIGMGVVIFGYAVVKDSTALIALRILHGIIFALNTTVNMAIIPGIVPQNQIGEAISYFGLSQSLAMAIGPAFGLWLAGLGGYPLTFIMAAVLCVAGGLFAIPFKLTEESAERVKAKGLKLSDIIVPKCLPFTMIEVTIASVAGIESSMMVLYAATQGIANIGWYFTVSAVVVCLCRLFLGKIIDRKGTFAVYPGLAMMIIGLLILWLQQGPWMFALAAVIKTVGASLAKPALQAAAVKSVTPDKRGAAVSTYYIGTDLGQGTAPMIGGKIVDLNGGNYGVLFMIFALPLALSGAAYHIINRHLQKKASLKEAV